MNTIMTILPEIFFSLLGIALLIYVILDGFDLGIGMLLPFAPAQQRDSMIAAIGPFWDANETWLVLGVGILLVAFPYANSIIAAELYMPITLMLIALVLRGAAFDFRVKVHSDYKVLWERLFFIGSAGAGIAQGWMLGRWLTGFADHAMYYGFAALIALALPAAYLCLGAAWLIIKTELELQQRAITWLKRVWPLLVIGIAAISLVTPLVSAAIAQRWFVFPEIFLLLPIPLLTLFLLLVLRLSLNSSRIGSTLLYVPFVCLVMTIALCFCGLAYSVYPYIVIGRMTMWQAALVPDSLLIILIGVAITLPVIVIYTVFSYRVFSGKATTLSYG